MGQTWLTEYWCLRCMDSVMHVEYSDDDDDDEPLGLPPTALRCPDCGCALTKLGETANERPGFGRSPAAHAAGTSTRDNRSRYH